MNFDTLSFDAATVWEYLYSRAAQIGIASINRDIAANVLCRELTMESFTTIAVDLQDAGLIRLSTDSQSNIVGQPIREALQAYALKSEEREQLWGCRCGAGFNSRDAYIAHRDQCDACKGAGNFFG